MSTWAETKVMELQAEVGGLLMACQCLHRRWREVKLRADVAENTVVEEERLRGAACASELDAIRRVQTLEAACAAMREALEVAKSELWCGAGEDDGDEVQHTHACGKCDDYVDRNCEVRKQIGTALSSDAGAVLLERLAQLERDNAALARVAEAARMVMPYADACGDPLCPVVILRAALDALAKKEPTP